MYSKRCSLWLRASGFALWCNSSTTRANSPSLLCLPKDACNLTFSCLPNVVNALHEGLQKRPRHWNKELEILRFGGGKCYSVQTINKSLDDPMGGGTFTAATMGHWCGGKQVLVSKTMLENKRRTRWLKLLIPAGSKPIYTVAWLEVKFWHCRSWTGANWPKTQITIFKGQMSWIELIGLPPATENFMQVSPISNLCNTTENLISVGMCQSPAGCTLTYPA